MRLRLPALCALCALAAHASAPDLSEGFFSNADNVILFLGDSITAAGGFITDLQTLIQGKYPGTKAQFVNGGKSSETVAGLTEQNHPGPRPLLFDRLDSVLNATKPKLVFACYGMNDGIYAPFDSTRFKAYRDGIARLQAAIAKTGAPLIIITPPVFDSLEGAKTKLIVDKAPFGYLTPYRDYDSVLAAYGTWLLTQRSANQMVVDLHGPMLKWVLTQRKTNPSFTWTPDAIHPDAAGHQVMAQAIFDGIFAPVTAIPGFAPGYRSAAVRGRDGVDAMGRSSGRDAGKSRTGFRFRAVR